MKESGVVRGDLNSNARGNALAKMALFLLFLIFGSAGGALGNEHAAGPENNGEKVQGSAGNFALVPVHLYQKYLSPVIGGRCPMYPSCSGYARQAIEKHGAVMGWIMACDRLMRCGRDEVKLATVVHEGQSTYCADPVENNDFWLK
jgi:uncharacterized protein